MLRTHASKGRKESKKEELSSLIDVEEFNNPQKIIVVGAGPIGLLSAIKLLERGLEVEIYEKRKESDIENLQAIFVIKESTLKLIPNEVKDYLFKGPKRKAYLHEPTSHHKYIHAAVDIRDLIKGFIKHLRDTFKVEVNRGYELTDAKDISGKKRAIFNSESGEVLKPYKYMIFACGLNESIRFDSVQKEITPHMRVGLQIPTIIAGFDFETDNYIVDDDNFVKNVEVSRGIPLKERGLFAGTLVLPNRFGFFTTIPWELKDAPVELQRNLMLEIFDEIKDIYPDIFKDGNILRPRIFNQVMAYSAAVSNSVQLNLDMFFFGDAHYIMPYIYGNEFNNTVTYLMDDLVETIYKLVNVQDEEFDKEAFMLEFDERIANLITNKKINPYFNAGDPFGLARDLSGKKVPIPDWLFKNISVPEAKLESSEEFEPRHIEDNSSSSIYSSSDTDEEVVERARNVSGMFIKSSISQSSPILRFDKEANKKYVREKLLSIYQKEVNKSEKGVERPKEVKERSKSLPTISFRLDKNKTHLITSSLPIVPKALPDSDSIEVKGILKKV